ncbi:hypothetical protein PIROE2DRAFT_3922 [Piromyces sp. E2]|nr:hypothetical protein PIROE2DRAFT_3922 [Piromyces sp. E2]|eukprot:OUM68330.1 hypothetical protein PIROE2DRAFT_3922 [Piromyces sp. E2]
MLEGKGIHLIVALLSSGVLITVGGAIPIALNTGRYVKYILMNKVNILKAQLLTIDKNNSPNQSNDISNDDNVFMSKVFGSESNNEINFEKSINKKQSIQLFCVENVLFWEMHHTLMTVVFDFYSASNSEKKKNKLIQKKNNIKLDSQNSIKVNTITKNDSGDYIVDQKTNNENNDNNETIDIVINKDDNHSFMMGNNKYDNAVINFINEKNITFLDTINENEVDNKNNKIDNVYKDLFKEYCQDNNIKLTNKELSIDSFLVYDQLIKYYQKIYDTFIDQNGVSPLNISDNVIEDVKNTLKNNTYSHKVYKQVLEEVIDMMYYNVYMNSIKKMSIS